MQQETKDQSLDGRNEIDSKLRPITQEEYDEHLRKHTLWLNSDKSKGAQLILPRTDFRSVEISIGTNLSSSALDSSVFSRMRLMGVDFSNASLASADFSHAELLPCERRDAMGTGPADLESVPVNFEGAILREAIFDDAKAHGTVFSKSDVRRCRFFFADL